MKKHDVLINAISELQKLDNNLESAEDTLENVLIYLKRLVDLFISIENKTPAFESHIDTLKCSLNWVKDFPDFGTKKERFILAMRHKSYRLLIERISLETTCRTSFMF